MKYPLFSGVTLLVAVVVFAAPVPTPPAEDLRTWKNQQEFDGETIHRATKVRTEELARGERVVTNKGMYASYYTDDGVMLLSTIPDGRLKYGFFSHITGESIPWMERMVPEACVGCHNRTRER